MMTPETLTPEQRAAALEAAAEIAEAHQNWVFARALREQAQAVRAAVEWAAHGQAASDTAAKIATANRH